ncbi:sensor histidine kinase [Undibacterium sp.]|uniref:sensor histidine kinase n=1 Tax=Undibacterium sp. TaxID=1914977 RepID=UPI0037507837
MTKNIASLFSVFKWHDILAAMNTRIPSMAIPTDSSTSWFKIIGINLLIWLCICTIGAAGNYQDILRNESKVQFLNIWLSWINGHVPLFFLSSLLHHFLQKRPAQIASAALIMRLYLLLSLSFFPLHILYITIPKWLKMADEHTLQSFFVRFTQNSNFTWFLEYAWFTGTFAVVIAVRIWHIGQTRSAILQQTQTAYLQLDLALEQQRLRSLRQQLEPHFIFNALNAISALVRTNEKSVALAGIHRLSDLLRYALTASNKDWVSFRDELDFIRDYLALQQLRYGERLEVIIEGDTPAILHGDCLPLLLQPLIENALRHDLDCHEECSQINLAFSLNVDQVTVTISNQKHDNSEKNPGLGLGLSQTRLRLEMMYKSKASMQISENCEAFCVSITTPLHRPDTLL